MFGRRLRTNIPSVWKARCICKKSSGWPTFCKTLFCHFDELTSLLVLCHPIYPGKDSILSEGREAERLWWLESPPALSNGKGTWQWGRAGGALRRWGMQTTMGRKIPGLLENFSCQKNFSGLLWLLHCPCAMNITWTEAQKKIRVRFHQHDPPAGQLCRA